MGKRGPKKKPKSLKLATGTYRNEQHDAIAPPGVAAPPETLTGDALAKWNEIAPLLAPYGLLSPRDGAALAKYCEAWALSEEASKLLAEGGMIVPTKSGYGLNPAFSAWTRSVDAMVKLGGRFGMTPGDRAGLGAPGGEPIDELEAFKRAT